MTRYLYIKEYKPPFPSVPIIFRNDERGLRTETANALLDTGSDGSLVPISYLQQILAPAVTNTRIRSHWGEWRSVQLFLVELELGDLHLPNIFVVGDEDGDEIILGRDVLNKLRVLLDGPANLVEIL